MNIVLISDPRVLAIGIDEICGETKYPWVDLRQQEKLKLDLSRRQIQKLSDNPFRVRQLVADKLILAQQILPNGFKFEIKECYRPLWVQQKFHNEYKKSLKIKFPEMNEFELGQEASKYLAPVSVAPHSTGGAVDLIILDQNGLELDMGTEFNASPVSTNNKTYTHNLEISRSAQNNRKIMVQAMSSVGFVNYPTEWWHWSYGDQYWAFCSGQSQALFQRQIDDKTG